MPESDNDRSVEYEGVTYTLVGRTTGADYIYINEYATREIDIEVNPTDEEIAAAAERGEDPPKPFKTKRWQTVPSRYDFANLHCRLRVAGIKPSVEDIHKLPRPLYYTLNTIAIEVDNLEAGESNDFLSKYLQTHPVLASLLGNSLPFLVPTPDTSPSEDSESVSDS